MDIINPLLYSEEAEKQLLGAIIINPGCLDQVDLSPTDFHVIKNARLMGVIQSMARSSVLPEYRTIIEYFNRKGESDYEKYINELVLGESPIFANTESLVRIVKDYSARRNILQNASELAKLAYDLERPIADPLANVVDGLVTNVGPTHGAEHWGTALNEFYDWAEERTHNPGEIWGIPSGFVDLDKATGGYHPGELIYIAGEPGIGKSILSVQMGVQMARAGYPGAIYSLEMGLRQVISRIISGLTKVRTRTIKQGNTTTEDWGTIIETIEEGRTWPLYLSEAASLTTQNLRADIARLKSRNKISWAVIDYDMLLDDGGGKLDETAFSSLVSKRLKQITKDMMIPIITVSSVTKDAIGEEGNTTMRGVRGGAQKLHNADLVMFLTKHNPNKGEWTLQNDNIRTLKIVKGRDLESLTSIDLVKFENYPAFGDAMMTKVKL